MVGGESLKIVEEFIRDLVWKSHSERIRSLLLRIEEARGENVFFWPHNYSILFGENLVI